MENDIVNTNLDEGVEKIENVDNTETTSDQTIKKQTSLDPAVMKELKSSQSLIGAALGGFIGASAGAAIWTIITAVTHYEIGYLAVAVGFLTGFMVRKFGHGFEKHFGYIGAIWSLAGCFVGNILTFIIILSSQKSIPFINVLHLLNLNIIISIIKNTFEPMDLLFYGIAIYEGYRFSFIKKNEIMEKLNKIINSNTQGLSNEQ